jgi:hypothetical protein
MRPELIPHDDEIYGWIEEVFRQGVRRPGYAADRWTEDFAQARFEALGLESVRREPIRLPVWEPQSWSLVIASADGRRREVPCYPLPHTASGVVEGPLVPLADGGQGVRDAIAVDFLSMLALRFDFFVKRSSWIFDPGRTFDGFAHVLPFGPRRQAVMEPAIEVGARAYVGVLEGYPPGTHDYYVPYDGVARPIPGVWVGRESAGLLRDALAAGAARGELKVASRRFEEDTYNIIGGLPGQSGETVIIGSHHDGPWSSAVEDGCGIAMVMAQAAYWSAVPREERPHNLLFLLTSGHMCGGAGSRGFISAHRELLESVVLELHLEHAALEHVERDGKLTHTGEPEPRWWFTTENPGLEDAVRAAISAEDLRRSLIVPPTIFGGAPTTDGGPFHPEGVPLVNFLSAPVYLFDSKDTLEKIDREHLAAITRAAARIIESTVGTTARSMREGVRTR